MEDLQSWLNEILPTGRKIINANYTRNNYEYIKKHYPDIWPMIRGKTFIIKGKPYTFKDFESVVININGRVIKTSRNIDNNFIKYLERYLKEVKNFCLKDFMKDVIQLRIGGIRLEYFTKRYFPEEYAKMFKFYKTGSKNERETVYRYLYDIKKVPDINGIPLKFHTLQYGYLGYKLYEKYEENIHDMISYYDVINLIFSLEQESNGIKDIKKYFPEIYKEVVEKYSIIEDVAEKFYLYINQMETAPKCIMCEKRSCKFSGSYVEGYYMSCSRKCANDKKSVTGIMGRKKAVIDYRRYKYDSYFYMGVTYRKYCDIIDPNKKRGKNFHLDHIIPVAEGFKRGLTPKEISHYKNLRILTAKDNLTKGSKLISEPDFIENLIKDIRETGVEYYTTII